MTDITVDIRDGVAVIALDRPERRNALTAALMAAVAETMAGLDDNAADQIAAGQQREWHVAREWRDRKYAPEQVASLQARIRRRAGASLGDRHPTTKPIRLADGASDMRLIVDGTADRVTVDDAEDLKGLSVELRGCSALRASTLLGDLGRVEGSHAWLHISALRAFVPQPRSCGWDERFQQAMTFAEQHGWTDQTGDFVRAHIASPSGPQVSARIQHGSGNEGK